MSIWITDSRQEAMATPVEKVVRNSSSPPLVLRPYGIGVCGIG